MVNYVQLVGYAEKTDVKKVITGCYISVIVEMNHRQITCGTEPNRSVSTQTKQSIGPEEVLFRRMKQLLSRRGNHSNNHSRPAVLVTQNYSKVDYIALRTVPIILKNGGRSLQVNAILDEASTKSYVNSDVAAELGLEGKTEKVNVNVLNGQIETFETKPVNFELQSVDGKVSLNVNAYTANRVTGDMNVIDWNEYRMKWPHLRSIKFPLNAKKPIVDVLLRLDCLDLLRHRRGTRSNWGTSSETDAVGMDVHR